MARLPYRNRTRTFQVQDANLLYLTAAQGGPGVNNQTLGAKWYERYITNPIMYIASPIITGAEVSTRVAIRAAKTVARVVTGSSRPATPEEKLRARIADVERRIGELKSLASQAGLLRASTDPQGILKAIGEIRAKRNRLRTRTGISPNDRNRLNQEAGKVDEALKVANEHAQQMAAAVQTSIQLQNKAALRAQQGGGNADGGLPEWAPIAGIAAAGIGVLMLLKG